jgi:hypothetical protein
MEGWIISLRKSARSAGNKKKIATKVNRTPTEHIDTKLHKGFLLCSIVSNVVKKEEKIIGKIKVVSV